jgi:hypothetical protein
MPPSSSLPLDAPHHADACDDGGRSSSSESRRRLSSAPSCQQPPSADDRDRQDAMCRESCADGDHLTFLPVDIPPSSELIADPTSCCTMSRITVNKLFCLGIIPLFGTRTATRPTGPHRLGSQAQREGRFKESEAGACDGAYACGRPTMKITAPLSGAEEPRLVTDREA